VHAGGRPDLGSDGQALLEAVLIHLRLLDDFLGNRKQRVRSVNRWNVWKRWRVWRRRPHVQDDVSRATGTRPGRPGSSSASSSARG
jgi:hypothetical protein